ncbi:LysR family transcriptional regulator [Methylocystis sp. 9N]|uniref:LysR family transcriptional regulator n=1 Tax=Methylocystis borbori TaxID=3118750 RepID=A0ABU7XC98_9HYPH
MGRFQELKTFVAVAETGGFAKAAAQLGSSPPAVTRLIASLEARLGVQLFHRTTRIVQLTESGRRFAGRARALLLDLEDAEKEAGGEGGAPSGHLTLTASATMGRSLLPPIVAPFLNANPRVSATLLLLDRVVNLIEEGVDIALRVGRLPGSSLISTRIGEVTRVLVASPDYLARRGAPRAPDDLRLHSIIAFTGLMPDREWRYGGVGAKGGRISLRPRLEINDALTAIASAEKGEGVTIALSYMVSEGIRSGRLVEVLREHTPPPIPVQLVYPESRLVAPKVRAFIDFAAPRLRAALGEIAPLVTGDSKISTSSGP